MLLICLRNIMTIHAIEGHACINQSRRQGGGEHTALPLSPLPLSSTPLLYVPLSSTPLLYPSPLPLSHGRLNIQPAMPLLYPSPLTLLPLPSPPIYSLLSDTTNVQN